MSRSDTPLLKLWQRVCPWLQPRPEGWQKSWTMKRPAFPSLCMAREMKSAQWTFPVWLPPPEECCRMKTSHDKWLWPQVKRSKKFSAWRRWSVTPAQFTRLRFLNSSHNTHDRELLPESHFGNEFE